MNDDILALIDNALDDYLTSDDAMRWTPEPPQPPDAAEQFVWNWLVYGAGYVIVEPSA